MREPRRKHSYLQRLPEEFYLGRATVLWSMTLQDRRISWLSDGLHFRFREILAHTQHREGLLCPAYVLMPDHLHLVWMGVRESSDQRRAAAFLRRYLNVSLRGCGRDCVLQLQGHDRVLRDNERERGAFQSTAYYVFENPVRAGLVDRATNWRYSGALVCGYPDLDWRQPDFWERFWKIHAIEIGEMAG